MLSRVASEAIGRRARSTHGASGRRERASMGLALLLVIGCAATTFAQTLPSEPFTWWNGRAVLSGDVAVSTSKRDPGWFNDADYGHNILRLATGGLSGSARLGRHVMALGEVRFENGLAPRVMSLFGRVRPWAGKPIDIQFGRVPPVFGVFARRRYGVDNPLIGYPLAYQYLTTLRRDAVPGSADALLAVRGSGWYVSYPQTVGSTQPHAGLPLVSALAWDTGVQVRVGDGPAEIAVAVTTGALGAPRLRDDNGGKQLSARLAVRPAAAVTMGLSASTGAFLSRTVAHALSADTGRREYSQRAVGVDVDVSRDYWQIRGEIILSAWQLPTIGLAPDGASLKSTALSLEGRYRIAPAMFAAARVEHLGFSSIAGAARPDAAVPWDAPVTRLELGGGYYVRRNVVAKLVFQQNWRAFSSYRQAQGQLAAQLAYWF